MLIHSVSVIPNQSPSMYSHRPSQLTSDSGLSSYEKPFKLEK